MALFMGLFLLEAGAQTWITHSTAGFDYKWQSLTYGNGKFIAVGRPASGVSDVIMTSTNGTTWSSVPHYQGPVNLNDVIYENKLYVAVGSYNHAGDNGVRLMTSPDGITWTTRSVQNSDWQSVAYGNGKFVAVASFVNTPDATKVMYSDDGISWTPGTPTSATNIWRGVTFGNGMFVAVSAYSPNGDANVMTSTDGINWTPRMLPGNGIGWSVAYGGGVFVVVGQDGTVKSSQDGINWFDRTTAAPNEWRDVVYGQGRFIAVASSGTGNRVMTSTEGINWNTENSAADNEWNGVLFANNLFVAVGETGTGNRVMTRTTIIGAPLPVTFLDFTGEQVKERVRLNWRTASEQNSSHFEIERSANGREYTRIGSLIAAGNSNNIRSYEFWDETPPVGTLLYRLKQVDVDGRFSYSKVVLIRSEDPSRVKIGPNPTDGSVTIQVPAVWDGRLDWRLYNAQGQLLEQRTGLISGNYTLDLSGRPAGLYQLILWWDGVVVERQRILRR